MRKSHSKPQARRFGPGDAPLDGFFLGEAADALGACLKDAVAHDLAVVFGQTGREVADEIAEHAVPTFRQVRRHAADAKPVGMHARPANGFDDAKRTLPVVERVEHRRKLPQVLRERAIPDQVADDPKQFGEHHADHLGARRNRDPGQFLHGHEVGEIVHHAAQVIHAIGVRNIGMPGLALTHLFGAAVMESDLGHRIDDLLAVELNHDPQDTVRARMLRPEVQKDEIAVVTAALHAPLFRAEAQQLLFGFLLLFGKLERPHFSGARRMIFSQRMPCPTPAASGCAAGAGVRKRRSRTYPILRARTSSPPARDP